ncbi:Cytosolic carboxypeptidase 1 [Nymphon striatum]|nr:Cytosolic carboxypeptidase 1 [Nymphon striatum]
MDSDSIENYLLEEDEDANLSFSEDESSDSSFSEILSESDSEDLKKGNSNILPVTDDNIQVLISLLQLPMKDFSEESVVSGDEDTDEYPSQLMQDLNITDDCENELLLQYSSFFSERPCHPSSMHGYPCCVFKHSNLSNGDCCSRRYNKFEVIESLTIESFSNPYELFSAHYKNESSKTKSVIQFIKLAYPDLHGNISTSKMENLSKKEDDIYRKRLLFELDQIFEPQETKNETVYDLDAAIKSSNVPHTIIGNDDEFRIGKDPGNNGKLMFESRFECGNLRKAIEVSDRVYNLILNPDINANGRHQWFYFEVYGMEAEVPYTFNIINCEKFNSQFNFGMQPLLYSVKEAIEWSNQDGEESELHLKEWNDSADSNQNIYFLKQKLCDSLGANSVDLLTITAKVDSDIPLQERKYIFLTARVHPGETNASWTLKGTIEFLLSNDPIAIQLREYFIFKIIPMLNPDGVINGNQRCSLLGVDLNRCWSNPNQQFHPEIFHAKQLFQYLKVYLHQTPIFYCDYHGHSRKKNVFLFGCSYRQSWYPEDRRVNDQCAEKFGKVCAKVCSAFSYSDCSFTIEKSRESTARVTVWRKFSCCLSYTLESSYCGFNQGPYKDFHINTSVMEEMGSQLCIAISSLLSANASSYADDRLLDSEINVKIAQSNDRKHSESSSQSDDDPGSNDNSPDDDQNEEVFDDPTNIESKIIEVALFDMVLS